MTDFEFERLTEADFEGISSLITNMSEHDGLRLRDKSPAYYRWMYLENPAGAAVVHSARHDGDIVASFAVAPKRFLVDGREVILGKTMDMFTAPAFQGRGLMRRCAERVFADAAAAGMVGWYVTPSVNSYPIFTGRWGYSESLRVIFRAKVLSYAAVLAAAVRPSGPARMIGRGIDLVGGVGRRGRGRSSTDHDVVTISRFDERADALWEKVSAGHRVAQIRDARYLNWRYVDNPDAYTAFGLERGGELTGIVVLTTTVRRGVRVGEVVDFLCQVDDDQTLRRLMSVAVGWARDNGMAMIQAWSIHGTLLDRRIRHAGLLLRRSEVKFLFSPDLPIHAVHEPEAWLLTQGDGNDV